MNSPNSENSTAVACDACQQSFSTAASGQRIAGKTLRSQLSDHWQKKHSSVEAVCDLCSCPFRTPHQLLRHFLAKHATQAQRQGNTEERVIVCDDPCGVAVSSKQYLALHFAFPQHHGPRFKFASDVYLKWIEKKRRAQVKIEQQRLDKTCDECGKAFRISPEFVHHFAAKHADESRVFWLRLRLRLNANTYSRKANRRLITCDDCGKVSFEQYVFGSLLDKLRVEVTRGKADEFLYHCVRKHAPRQRGAWGDMLDWLRQAAAEKNSKKRADSRKCDLCWNTMRKESLGNHFEKMHCA